MNDQQTNKSAADASTTNSTVVAAPNKDAEEPEKGKSKPSAVVASTPPSKENVDNAIAADKLRAVIVSFMDKRSELQKTKVKFNLQLDVRDNLRNFSKDYFRIDNMKVEEWVLKDSDGVEIMYTDLLEVGEWYNLVKLSSVPVMLPSAPTGEDSGYYTPSEGAPDIKVKAENGHSQDPIGELVEDSLKWIQQHDGKYVEPSQKDDPSHDERSLSCKFVSRRKQYKEGALSDEDAKRLADIGIPGFSPDDKVAANLIQRTSPRVSKSQKRYAPTSGSEETFKKRQRGPTLKNGKSLSDIVKPEFMPPQVASKGATKPPKLTSHVKPKLTSHAKLPKLDPGVHELEKDKKRVVYCTKEGETISDVATAFNRTDVDRIIRDNSFLVEKGEQLSPDIEFFAGGKIVLYLP